MRKNLFKKAGAAVLGLVLAGSLLAGCGSGSSATQQGADEPQAEAVEEQAEEAVEESADAGYRTLEQIQADGKVIKQSGVNYIVGLQPSLTKAKFQNTYIEYENVKVTIDMTTTRYLGTGSTVTVTSVATGEVIGEYVVVIYGDVDGTATINGRDATAISNSLSGATATLTGAAKLAANVEGTRPAINLKDASVIRSAAAGKMVIDQSTGKGVAI